MVRTHCVRFSSSKKLTSWCVALYLGKIREKQGQRNKRIRYEKEFLVEFKRRYGGSECLRNQLFEPPSNSCTNISKLGLGGSSSGLTLKVQENFDFLDNRKLTINPFNYL